MVCLCVSVCGVRVLEGLSGDEVVDPLPPDPYISLPMKFARLHGPPCVCMHV